MSSTVTYSPAVHCVLHFYTTGEQIPATRAVSKPGRVYHVCDAHYEIVERCPTIADAMREVKRRKAIGGAV